MALDTARLIRDRTRGRGLGAGGVQLGARMVLDAEK